jgi:hypothetical protein
MNEDIDNMTPMQKLVVGFIIQDIEVVDTDGDDLPDEFIWEYEQLMETPEGQAWTANMESGDSWVNDVFDDFNSLPEDCFEHLMNSFEDPAWESAGQALDIHEPKWPNACPADSHAGSSNEFMRCSKQSSGRELKSSNTSFTHESPDSMFAVHA